MYKHIKILRRGFQFEQSSHIKTSELIGIICYDIIKESYVYTFYTYTRDVISAKFG